MVENTQTIFFVKPRDFYRGSEIYDYLFQQLSSDFVIVERKIAELDYLAWMEFYEEMGQRFHQELEQMARDFSGKEIDLSLLEGPKIAQRVRGIVGPTKYGENPACTIRGKFGPYELPNTIVHASDAENVGREILLLKKYGALVCWT